MFLALIYFYSFALISYVANNSIRGREKRKRFETVACFLLLFVFFGFRDLPILNDTAHYYEHFYDVLNDGQVSLGNILQYNIYDRFSVGYQIYERFVGMVFQHPYMIICISSLIITSSFIYFARTHTTKISFFIFICLTTFMLNVYSGLRQGLATCIFLFAITALEKKRTVIYFLLILLAMSFHSSAIILLILPILRKVPLNKLTIVIVAIATIILALGINYFVELAGLDDTVYFDVNNGRKTLPIGSIINSLILLFILLFSFRLRSSLSITNNSITSLYWWVAIITLVFSILDTQFPILGRFCMYFNAVVYIMFLYYVEKINVVKERKFVTSFMILFLMFRMAIILGLKPEWYHMDDYSFYDFSVEVHETRLGY